MTLIKTNFIEKECWEAHCKYKMCLIHFLDCFNIGKEAQKTIHLHFFFFSSLPVNGVFGTYGVLVANVTEKSQSDAAFYYHQILYPALESSW